MRTTNSSAIRKILAKITNITIDNIMNKHFILMRDVVCRHHPKFVKSRDLTNFGLSQPLLFNIERLVEETLAAVGGYNFVDEDYRDFDDRNNSDSKTTTVIPDGNSKTAVISSIENKIGSLRITIYNPFKETTDFMYIPKRHVGVLKEPCYGKNNSLKEKLRIRWNQAHDHYNGFEQFRVGTFQDLATACG